MCKKKKKRLQFLFSFKSFVFSFSVGWIFCFNSGCSRFIIISVELTWRDLNFLRVFFSFLALCVCFGPAVIHRSCCRCQLFSREGRGNAQDRRAQLEKNIRGPVVAISKESASCLSVRLLLVGLHQHRQSFGYPSSLSLSTPMFPVWLIFIIRQDAIALTLQALLPDALLACFCNIKPTHVTTHDHG